MVMMMKISKSKKELASIISENGGWRNVAEFAWYGNRTKKGWFGISKPRYSPERKSLQILGNHITGSFPCRKPNNWHKTILSREEYFHLYPSPDADGWIEWSGGACPVPEGTLIDVRYRDGEELLGIPALISAQWREASPDFWRNDECNVDIVAYRLARP